MIGGMKFIGLALFFLTAVPAPLASPGNEVVIVFNTRLPESKAVADHYARVRKVPETNILGLDLPTTEEISRAVFREALQRPLAEEMITRRLWHIAPVSQPGEEDASVKPKRRVVESKIRYAILCYGVPLKIAPESNLHESGLDQLRPEMKRNEAAVDSELALLPSLHEALPLSGPLRNPVYSSTNALDFHPTNGVLMVSRLDGPTPDLAKSMVDKAVLAESEGLWGRGYFDLRSTADPSMKLGEDWISSAAGIYQRLGFDTVVDTNSATFPAGFPMSHIGFYIGWYAEHVSGVMALPPLEFMPGAFGYHLHSFSAATLRSTNRHWVGPLVAGGVTISMGTVYEPYLGGTPDMAIFPSRLIYSGFSFGEAAYASQAVLSWQTTVVGDPLYRPYGESPERLHDRLQETGNKALEWSYLRLLNLNLITGKSLVDCSSLLEQLGLTKTSAVLSEKLADLYALQGKPSSAIQVWQRALKQNPSRQQRVRLNLVLTEKLMALNRNDEAFQLLQDFVIHESDYPDRQTLHRKLASLAQKLDKPEEARKHEAEAARLSPPTKP